MLRGRRFEKSAREENETASECEKLGAGEGGEASEGNACN